MAVVIFYKTTENGSEEIGRVTHHAGQTEGPQNLVARLLDAGQRIDVAMREAPRRFNGSYLRAEFIP